MLNIVKIHTLHSIKDLTKYFLCDIIIIEKQRRDYDMSEDFTNIKTPHIVVGDVAFNKTVLMPGCPKRAERIANEFLSDVVVISDVRGIKAYNGIYHNPNTNTDTPVTVMASGMGMPSIGIYSHELYNFFGVENIIRVGSAGALNNNLNVGDIVIAQSASTNGNYANAFIDGNYAPTADFETIMKIYNSAKEMKIAEKVKVGNVLSSDVFYSDSKKWSKMGVLCVEMEAAALFTEASMAGKKASAVCTISDIVYDTEKEHSDMTSEERQNNLMEMVEMVLNGVTK